MKRIAPPKKDGDCSMREWLSTGILGAVPSALSPEPHTTDTHMTLVWSTLSPPESRVSGYKQNYVHWPFKRGAYVSSRLWSLTDGQKSIPTDFHSQMLCGHLFQLWCSGLVSLAWGWDPTLLSRNPPCLRYPCRTLATTHGTRPSFFMSPPFLPVLKWLLLQVLGCNYSSSSL